MKLSDGNLISMMDMLVANGAKDPAGILAQIEATDDEYNITGITEAEADRVGLREARNEPVMSFMGAMMSDLHSADPDEGRHRVNPDTAGAAKRNRDAVFERASNAMMRGVLPENPFVDQSGMLVMKRNKGAEPKPYSEDAIKAKIEEYFNKLDN